MTCMVCNKKYVGETSQSLALRMNLHRSDCKTRKHNRSPVAEHFNQPGHTFADIELCCIEFRQWKTDVHRKERETYWIRRLNTLHPQASTRGTETLIYPTFSWVLNSIFTFSFDLDPVMSAWKVWKSKKWRSVKCQRNYSKSSILLKKTV